MYMSERKTQKNERPAMYARGMDNAHESEKNWPFVLGENAFWDMECNSANTSRFAYAKQFGALLCSPLYLTCICEKL